MSTTLKISDHGYWVELTLNRPEKLNAFNDEMLHALISEIQAAIKSGKRAVLLTGAGRGFCAGQDLGDRDPAKMTTPPDLGATLTNFYNPLVHTITQCDIPIICAVNGVAAGAGANLAMACDITFASTDAKFIQAFSLVGLIPDCGGTWQLVRRLGPARAKALAITAEPILAEQAADWGMIWKSVPHEKLMDEARALTTKLADGPGLSYAHIKKAVYAATTNSLPEQLALEAQYQKRCGESRDYAEGVSAFLSKRKPEFQGV